MKRNNEALAVIPTGPTGPTRSARTSARPCHARWSGRTISVASGLVLFLAAAIPVFAHHGPGAYDRSREVTVTGTVTRFQFVNPHVLIFVAVHGDGERSTEWAGELTSPNRLARMGGGVAWHKDLLQPGDTVTLTGNPAHNGAPALLLSRVVDGDGRVLTSSGR